MKRVLSIALVLIMCFALVACSESANDKVKEYIDENREEILDSMEESFAYSSGMTCTSSIKVVDAGFIVNININELDDVPEETKEQMQDAYDSLGNTFEGMLEDMQEELPELEYFTIKVCDKDGEVLATIGAGK